MWWIIGLSVYFLIVWLLIGFFQVACSGDLDDENLEPIDIQQDRSEIESWRQ
jgi:hypothetical protein